jgi:hypothetical protein
MALRGGLDCLLSTLNGPSTRNDLYDSFQGTTAIQSVALAGWYCYAVFDVRPCPPPMTARARVRAGVGQSSREETAECTGAAMSVDPAA